MLKKITKLTLDNSGIPKSRNIKQLIFYLKYFILILEWFKESQVTIPEHIDETIYYLGQGYAFIWKNSEADFLFNGNNISKNYEFDNYLNRLGYRFKNEDKEYAFYNNCNYMNTNDLQLWKINQAIPSLDSEINGKNNPLELGLADLIDFNKGCYLGQETISKIRNVSSLKQEIRVWTAEDSAFNLNSENKNLYNNEKKEKSVGYITSHFKLSSQTLKGLAMIKRKYLDSGNTFFTDSYCKISIDKSIGSTFL